MSGAPMKEPTPGPNSSEDFKIANYACLYNEVLSSKYKQVQIPNDKYVLTLKHLSFICPDRIGMDFVIWIYLV